MSCSYCEQTINIDWYIYIIIDWLMHGGDWFDNDDDDEINK